MIPSRYLKPSVLQQINSIGQENMKLVLSTGMGINLIETLFWKSIEADVY